MTWAALCALLAAAVPAQGQPSLAGGAFIGVPARCGNGTLDAAEGCDDSAPADDCLDSECDDVTCICGTTSTSTSSSTTTTSSSTTTSTAPPACVALTANYSVTAGASFSTASISPAGDRLLVLAVLNQGPGSAESVSSVTGNGLTWVQMATTNYAGASSRLSAFRAMGAAPTAGAISIDFPASQNVAIWSVLECDGVETGGTAGSDAVRQPTTATVTPGTTIEVGLGAFASSLNGAIGLFAHSAGNDIVPGSGFTELSDVSSTTPIESLGVSYRADNDITVDASVSPAATVNWGAIAFELVMAGGGGTTTSSTSSTSTSVTSSSSTSTTSSSTTSSTVPGATTSTSSSSTSSTSTSTSSTTSTTAAGGSGQVIYWGPSGNDGNSGASVGQAVRTFGKAKSKVTGAGAMIVALDGTYTRGTTGFPTLDCGDPNLCTGPDRCGTAANPIRVVALNDRGAHLDNDGTGGPIVLSHYCRGWTFEHFEVSNADATGPQSSNFEIEFSEDITIADNTIHHNNRKENNHLVNVDHGARISTIRNEFYWFHRHGISYFKVNDGFIAWNYLNSRGYPDGSPCQPIGQCGTTFCCSNHPGGDEDISLYGANGTKVLSNVMENGGGIQNHGIPSGVANGSPYGPDEYGGSQGLIAGNIDRAGNLCIHAQSRSGAPHASRNNIWREHLCLGTKKFAAVTWRAASQQTLEGVTIWGTTPEHGFSGLEETVGVPCSDLAAQGDPCKFILRNLIVANSAKTGLNLADLTSDYVCSGFVDKLLLRGNAGGVYGGIFQSRCSPTNVVTNPTLTGLGTGNGEQVVFIPSTATSAYGTGNTSVPLKVCHGSSGSAYRPCTSNSDCAVGDTCLNDHGANLLTRWAADGSRTSNWGCTGNGTPWPWCTGLHAGHVELWAQSSLDCGGVPCTTQASDCNPGTHTSGGYVTCKNHLTLCGKVIAGVSSQNDDSCGDLHERLHLGQRPVDAVLPAIP